MVLIAIILFKSFWSKPLVAPYNAVVEPIIVIVNNTVGAYSKIGELLSNK